MKSLYFKFLIGGETVIFKIIYRNLFKLYFIMKNFENNNKLILLNIKYPDIQMVMMNLSMVY